MLTRPGYATEVQVVETAPGAVHISSELLAELLAELHATRPQLEPALVLSLRTAQLVHLLELLGWEVQP